MSGFVTSGRFNLGAQRLAGRDLYLPAYAAGSFAGPRFYFLIASERPLDLSRFGAYGMGIRSVLGTNYAASSPYRTMEQLAEVALPSMEDDGSWTTDLYMHWPEAVSTVAVDRAVLLTCNGYRVYVRLEYLLQAQQALCGTRSESPVQPGDSARAPEGEVIPQRRPPRESGSDLRDRVRSSAQLDEVRETRERRTTGVQRPGQSGYEGDSPRTRGGVTQPAAGRRGQPGEERGARTGSSDPGNAPAQARPERRERPSPPAREATPQSAPAPTPAPAPAREPSQADPRPAPTPAPAPTPERCADC
jgi:hypothetical protein